MNVGNLDLRKHIQRRNGTLDRPLIGELWARDSMGATAAMKEVRSSRRIAMYVHSFLG